MSYSSVILADSPIRYYRLGETSGTFAIDGGSQAQNGTYTGGVTLNQTSLLVGDSDPSVLLNGTTGYVSLPTTGLPTGASAWTLEAWVKMPAILPSSAFYPVMIFFGNDAAGATNGAALVFNNGTGFLVATGNSVAALGGTVAANGIYHVVGTYNGTTATLYINGVSINSAAFTFTVSLTMAGIGNDNSNDFWTGTIDEAAIYSTALSATQVLAHYTAGTTASVHFLVGGGYGGVFS